MGAAKSGGGAAMAKGEFLRAIKTPDGSNNYLIDPAALAPDPFVFGMALVDCARHGARAWEQATGVDEATVLARIWEGVDAERDSHTTELN